MSRANASRSCSTANISCYWSACDSPGRTHLVFRFADTVATKSYKGNNDAQGWMGIRCQIEPGGVPSEIVLHVRLWDKEAVLQQQALGIGGTNLIYAAFYYPDDPKRLIESLVDIVGTVRMEVDMVQFAGPAFANLDNRIMSLHLVQLGPTNAVMFSPSGEVLQPSEVRYKKAVLMQRGSFRPITRINVDMFACGTAQFGQEPRLAGTEIVVLAEIPMNTLLADGALDPQDFLSRVDLIGELGFTTLISNYSEYYRLASYFRRYTREMIGIAMGVGDLLEIFDESTTNIWKAGFSNRLAGCFATPSNFTSTPGGRPAVINRGKTTETRIRAARRTRSHSLA